MLNSDWRHNTAVIALIALVLFTVFAGYRASEISNGEARSPAVQGLSCEPTDDRDYQCLNLIAQQKMSASTELLAAQGDRQILLALVNLVLLIATLSASAVATYISGRAVKTARTQAETSLQPRLAVQIQDGNWKPPQVVDELKEKLLTTFSFKNFGEASASLRIIFARHYVRDAAEGPPPPLDPARVANYRHIPEGNWVASLETSQEFSSDAAEDVGVEPLPTSVDWQWYFMGFVIYEGLHGVVYLTRFCYTHYDIDESGWFLGPERLENQFAYHGTQRLDKRWWREYAVSRLVHSQQ